AAYQFSMSGKRLELLKEIAPGVKRVAVIRDPSVPAGSGGLAAIQTVAPSLGVELTPVGVRDAGEIERAITVFARGSNGGLILVGPSSSVARYRDLIIALAARHRLPAIYPGGRQYVTGGGLISYGPDAIDQDPRAGAYVDRILKGEKPADLPVQQPTKFELIVNLKTAEALGLEVPPTLLARDLRGEKAADLPVQAPTKFELAINLKVANALGLILPPTPLAPPDVRIE